MPPLLEEEVFPDKVLPLLVPAARWDASRAITLEREIRGLRPFNDLALVIVPEDVVAPLVGDEMPSSAAMLVVSPLNVRFFTGVGIPDCCGSNKGLLNIPPDFGENGRAGEAPEEAPTAGLLVMELNAFCEYGSSETDLSPALDVLVVFANELAVGANSLEDVVDNLELVREATDDDVPPPRIFLDPMLPMVPCVDKRVVAESLLPIDETFVLLLVLDRVVRVPAPMTEPAREGGLAIELVRLLRVPPLTKEAAALLCRLFLLELVLNEGIGERERVEEDAIEPLVAVVAESPLSWSAFCFALLTRMEGTPLPLATVLVGRAGAGALFFAGRRVGGPIFFSLFGVSSLIIFDVGFGILLGVALGGAFPRFHTFCTRVLADERNPNLEGFGLGLTGRVRLELEQVLSWKNLRKLGRGRPTLTRPLFRPGWATLLRLRALLASSFLRIASFSCSNSFLRRSFASSCLLISS